MSRKICVLMLLLIFVASDTALGWHRRCRRPCAPCPCPSTTPGPTPEPFTSNYCLQDWYQDFSPGPDLFFCLAWDQGCNNGDVYEDLWYGFPTTAIPQSCTQCESGGFGVPRAVGGGPPPRHEQIPSADPAYHAPFPDETTANDWIKNHIAKPTTNGKDKYYKFNYTDEQGNTKSLFAVMWHIKGKNSDLRYFGVETKDFGNSDSQTITDVKLNKKKTVMSFKYNNGNKPGLLWLK